MNNNTQICSSLEELIAYKNNKLSTDKEKLLKEHFSECKLCSDAYDGLCAEPNIGKTIDTINTLKKNILNQSRKNKSNNKKHMLLAAITFSFLISLFFINDKVSNVSVFEKYFEPYPNTFPITRSINEVTNFEKAMIEYEQKNYFESIKLLNIIITADPTDIHARLYAGISNLAINKPNEAISQFNDIVSNSGTDLKNEAKWFLTLAYIKKGELERAKNILNDLQSQQGKYYNKSNLLLKELNTFD